MLAELHPRVRCAFGYVLSFKAMIAPSQLGERNVPTKCRIYVIVLRIKKDSCFIVSYFSLFVSVGVATFHEIQFANNWSSGGKFCWCLEAECVTSLTLALGKRTKNPWVREPSPTDIALIRAQSDKLSEKFHNLLPPLKVHNASEAAM